MQPWIFYWCTLSNDTNHTVNIIDNDEKKNNIAPPIN